METGRMKRDLIFLAVAILLIWSASWALEWHKTIHGSIDLEMALNADSTSCGTLQRDSSAADWIKADGDYLKFHYRTKVDTVFKTAEDSLFILFTFSPQKGDSTADTTGAGIYKIDSINIAAPSTSWAYGYKLYNLYNDSTQFANLVKIWFQAVDSSGEASSDSTIAGNSYTKQLEYWLEIWK